MPRKSQWDYLTPSEILEKYPELKEKHGITEHTLGILMKHHMLWGQYESGKRHAFIREDSVVRLIEFINNGLHHMLIPIKPKDEE